MGQGRERWVRGGWGVFVVPLRMSGRLALSCCCAFCPHGQEPSGLLLTRWDSLCVLFGIGATCAGLLSEGPHRSCQRWVDHEGGGGVGGPWGREERATDVVCHVDVLLLCRR